MTSSSTSPMASIIACARRGRLDQQLARDLGVGDGGAHGVVGPLDETHARSDRPRRVNSSSSALGIWISDRVAPSAARGSAATQRSGSAPTRSHLLMKAMRGTRYLSACRQTVSDCGSTPPTAQNTATAPSSTRRLRSTSMVKSTWPGVSMMLMRWSRQKQVVDGGGDGDAALLLLLHPVHGRGALVDLADLVRDAGVVQDALGGRGLPRIDVRHDPDVSGPSYGELTSHDFRAPFQRADDRQMRQPRPVAFAGLGSDDHQVR